MGLGRGLTARRIEEEDALFWAESETSSWPSPRASTSRSCELSSSMIIDGGLHASRFPCPVKLPRASLT